ncbi:DNA-directed RNA polymerase [Xylaria sp. CBS 124048]|nr:DNA-directed RNA polymerase [Xylaria sp. CBS 124048]
MFKCESDTETYLTRVLRCRIFDISAPPRTNQVISRAISHLSTGLNSLQPGKNNHYKQTTFTKKKKKTKMPGRTLASASGAEDAEMEDASTVVPPSAQRSTDSEEGGEPMEEDEEEETGGNGGAVEEEEEEEPQRVRILPGSTSTAASFEFLKEGHTLGNALRYIIMKNPDVEFCAYAIPHPSEEKMNLRIQTYDTTTATAALEKGLQDLEDLCDVVSDEFWTQREKFMASK